MHPNLFIQNTLCVFLNFTSYNKILFHFFPSNNSSWDMFSLLALWNLAFHSLSLGNLHVTTSTTIPRWGRDTLGIPFGLSFKVNIVTSNTRAVTQARRISSDVVRISIERTTLPPSRLTCSKSPSLPSQPLLRTCGHSLAGGQIPSAFQRVGSINCPERRSHAGKEPSWVLISVSTNHFDCVYWPDSPCELCVACLTVCHEAVTRVEFVGVERLAIFLW